MVLIIFIMIILFDFSKAFDIRHRHNYLLPDKKSNVYDTRQDNLKVKRELTWKFEV